jgi:hypothetical protein
MKNQACHFGMTFFNDITRDLSPIIGTFLLPSPEDIEDCKTEILKQDCCIKLTSKGFRLLTFNWAVIPANIAPMNREDV